jgi:hypothetical protein
MLLSTLQLNVGICICATFLLFIPIVWTKTIFNENPTKWYKKLKAGALLLLVPCLLGGYLSYLKDKSNDRTQDGLKEQLKNVSGDLKTIEDTLKSMHLKFDQKAKVVYRDTTFGLAAVSICNTPDIKLIPAEKDSNSFDYRIYFCASNDVRKFEAHSFNIICSNRLHYTHAIRLGDTYFSNDFLQKNIAFWDQRIHLGSFSLDDSIIIYVKYKWENRIAKDKGYEKRFLIYLKDKGYFSFLENPPNYIITLLKEEKMY